MATNNAHCTAEPIREGPGPLPAPVRRAVLAAAVLAILIGAFWLGAWFTGYAARHSLAGVITMKTNMALGQLLAGVALLLLGARPRNGVSRWVGALFAALTFLIGALTLGEHLLGLDLGIDQLLAKEPPGSAATLSPNRMGYPGSSSLALLGIGLLSLAFNRRAIVPYLGIAVCVINLIPAVGFLYGIGTFYQMALTGIAWPTVIVLMSLGVGLILTRTDGGPMALLLRDDAGGRLLRGMLPWVILVPLALGYVKMSLEYAGIGPTGSRTGLLIITLILMFSAVLWRSARKLSRSDMAHREDEDALREAVERYELVLAGAEAAIWDWDVPGHKVVFSPRWKSMRGFAEHEISDAEDEWSRRIHPEDVPRVMAAVQAHFDGETPFFSEEYRICHKDGSWLWIADRGLARRDASGRVVRMAGSETDITDRKRAEEARRELEAHKREFYQRTILAATEGKLLVCEKQEIEQAAGPALASWQLEGADSLSEAVRGVQDLATGAGMEEQRIHDLLSCVTEAVTNAIKHADGGVLTVHRVDDRVLCVVSDRGPGIGAMALPDVALTKYYSTAGTLGMGFKMMIRFSDRVYLATGPEGTTVAVEMGLEPRDTATPGADDFRTRNGGN